MRITLVACLSLALAACSPPEAAKTAPDAETPAPATASADERAEFSAAGGNVGCTYTPAGGTPVYTTPDGRAELFCDRIEPTYVRLSMSEQGAARVVATQERGCCGGEMLAAGARWSRGPFSCEVSEVGVVCTNSDGHGFSISSAQTNVH
jgi:hypothetical protein